ncbi:MAG: ComEC/Rec2 family competence protein [Kiloniellales bacterium]|nr:ComEC/Rec2 family competence protein [Kiloniellales bacterium]
MASLKGQALGSGSRMDRARDEIRKLRPLGQGLARQLTDEQDRWVLWLPVALGAGIGLYFLLPAEPHRWLGPALLCAVLGLVAATHRLPGGRILGLLLGAIALGFAVAQFRVALVAAPVLEERIGPTRVVGQVVAAPPRAAGERIVLRALEIEGLRGPTPARARLRLTSRDPAGISPGDWIELRAVLRPPPEPAAPGSYDFARRAYFERIGAVGFAVSHVTLRGSAHREDDRGFSTRWRLWWAELRQTVGERVLARVPDANGAVAVALMTGDRSAIPESVIVAMRDAGLAHLLAISGLHLGLVAGLLFFSVRALLAGVPALALRYPIKKWAAVIAWPGALTYLFLVGATIPTQRAFLMVSLALLAVLLDRSAISLRLVAWAAVVVLLAAPESLLTASFQMSFAAVVALVAAYEALRGRFAGAVGGRGPLRGAALYFAGVALTSVIAIVATGPFAAYHFNRMATYGLLANLIAVPVTAFWVMPAAMVAYLALPFGLEALPLTVMSGGVSVILTVAREVAALPGAVRLIEASSFAAFVSVILGGLWLCIWRRPWRLFGLGAVGLGIAAALWVTPPDILVDGGGRLLALRDPDGRLWLSTTRRESFTAGVWLRRAGQGSAEPWPLEEENPASPLLCDSSGCVARIEEHLVAFALSGAALEEDCRRAGVLISLEPFRGRCPKPAAVIDLFDLWREGAHAIWLHPRGLTIETVAGDRGRRPWVRQR